MKAVSARVSRALNLGANVFAADNSGARIVRITSVKHGKSTKGRQQYARVGDWVKCSVRAGKPEMRGQVFDAVVDRKNHTEEKQAREFVLKTTQLLCSKMKKEIQKALKSKDQLQGRFTSAGRK